jgi:hypothetical protein
MQKESRSLEEALADLLAAHQRAPDPKRVRIIEIVRAEIQYRKAAQASPFGHVMEDHTEEGRAA